MILFITKTHGRTFLIDVVNSWGAKLLDGETVQEGGSLSEIEGKRS